MAALLKEYLGTSYLFGANAPFIEELYEGYLADPASVPAEWRRYFDQLQQLPGSPDVAHEPIRQSFVKLVKAPRAAAGTRPRRSRRTSDASRCGCCSSPTTIAAWACGRPTSIRSSASRSRTSPSSIPASYGLTEEDMEATFNTASMFGPEQMPLREIVRALRETYCGSIGAEYWYIADPAPAPLDPAASRSRSARSRATRPTSSASSSSA